LSLAKGTFSFIHSDILNYTLLDSQNKDLLARIIRQEEEIGILYHKERVQKKAINALWLTLGTAIFGGVVYILLMQLF